MKFSIQSTGWLLFKISVLDYSFFSLGTAFLFIYLSNKPEFNFLDRNLVKSQLVAKKMIPKSNIFHKLRIYATES